MQTSQNGRKFIESFEGCILQAYDDFNDKVVNPGDVVHGTLTIGYGHTSVAGPPIVSIGQSITQSDADAIFASDIQKVEQQVTDLVKVPLTQDQFDALVSFQFNTGALAKSSALVFLNQGNYAEAADRLTLYVYSKGKVMPGLQKRRAAERNLFLQGVTMPANQTEAPAHPVTTSPQPQLPLQLPQIDFTDIDATLQAINGWLPQLLSVVGTFYPPAAAFAKFLPLVAVLIQGVHIVATSANTSANAASQEVAQHLTPNQPNSTALNG